MPSENKVTSRRSGMLAKGAPATVRLSGLLLFDQDCVGRQNRKMAEREGFEPSVGSRPQRFSRPPRSTTPAPLPSTGFALTQTIESSHPMEQPTLKRVAAVSQPRDCHLASKNAQLSTFPEPHRDFDDKPCSIISAIDEMPVAFASDTETSSSVADPLDTDAEYVQRWAAAVGWRDDGMRGVGRLQRVS